MENKREYTYVRITKELQDSILRDKWENKIEKVGQTPIGFLVEDDRLPLYCFYDTDEETNKRVLVTVYEKHEGYWSGITENGRT